MTDSRRTRRDLLRATAVAITLGYASNPGMATEPVEAHSTSRSAFEEVYAEFHEDGGYLGKPNDSTVWSGLLAWGESYLLRAYLLMYRAHGDRTYLDQFVEHADAVLRNRDSARGVTDYRGRSLPAWRSDTPFTIGRVEVPDASGRPLLAVRSALEAADECSASVESDPANGTFSLVVRHLEQDLTTRYSGLTMDPDDANYAVRRINREGFREKHPSGCRVTVEDLRDSPSDGAMPAAGEYQLVCPYYIYAVHTGMITFPLASFARLVSESPQLGDDSKYAGRAERYARAAERAVAVHDHQWRETEQGGGYYVFTPAAPTPLESVELPHNQSIALGRTLVQLAAVTGKQRYAERARKLAVTFRNDLQTDDSDAYVWSYWWSDGAYVDGWTLDDPRSEYMPWMSGIADPVTDWPEDIDHGHIDVDFAALLTRSWDAIGEGEGVFDDADLERFARTYTENLATTHEGEPTVHRLVDGSGAHTGDHLDTSTHWNRLSHWSRQVFSHSRDVYGARRDEFAVGTNVLFGIATLNYWS